MVLYIVLGSLFLFSHYVTPKDHYPNGDHNTKYDQQAFLGEDGMVVDQLSAEESQQRLSEIFDKADGQILADGFVTEEELQLWIQYTKKRYSLSNTKQQMEKTDLDGDGSVTLDEYKRVTYGYLDDATTDDHDARGLAHDEKRFKLADQEGDMKLNVNEFSAFLHPEDHPYMISHMVNDTIKELDKDKDGLINLDEYLHDITMEGDLENGEPEWFKGEKKQFIDILDRDKDGKLDWYEVREWITPQDYVISEGKHLMSESDADGDGRISKPEMMEKYKLFAGSQVTDFGDLITTHEEL